MPDEAMVERVARAIAAEDNEEGYDAWEANPGEPGRRCWFEYARAALEASGHTALLREIEGLRSALGRLDRNFDLLLAGKPVHDVAETKAETRAALSRPLVGGGQS
jgi:hypothetical protein